MRSRLLLNLVLLVVVAGLGLLFWLAPDEPADPAVAISDIDIDSVQTIRLERDGHETITIVREGNNWRLTEPLAMDADNNRAEGLLWMAAIASQHRLAAVDLNLGRYGLEPARTVLALDDHRFVIGDEHPMQPQRYVLYQDDVHLVPDTLHREIQAPPTYYANGRLLPVDDQLLRLSLPHRTLIQSDGEWSTDPPLQDRSPNAAGNAWRTAHAMTVRKLEESDNDYHGEVIAEFEQADPVIFKIASPAPNVILARPELGIQYHIGGEQAVRLLLVDE